MATKTFLYFLKNWKVKNGTFHHYKEQPFQCQNWGDCVKNIFVTS